MPVCIFLELISFTGLSNETPSRPRIKWKFTTLNYCPRSGEFAIQLSPRAGGIFYLAGTFQILGGCQGRRTGVGVTTVSNSLILGGWVTKVLKNGDKK